MHESLIVKHCSPTLAGIKTGSLFSCQFNCIYELKGRIEEVNSIINLKGVYMCLLRNTYKKALIYVYRLDRLERDFLQEEARDILIENGYCVCDIDACVDRLSNRLSESQGFPHEIGLFLGYPPHDVKAFIKNEGRNFKCVGYWKVYGDESRAQKTFKKYKKCTNIYCKKLSEGLSIQRLTVAV